MRELREYFSERLTDAGYYAWCLETESLGPSRRADLLRDFAANIMEYHCGQRQDRYEAWVARSEGGAAHTELMQKSLETIISMLVGLSDSPRSQDHLEASIAEHLWYFLTLESTTSEEIQRAHGPSVDVTDPGGDGLIIHQLAENAMFRLWEIKKHTSQASTASTASRASKQLRLNAPKYLHRFSLLGQYDPDEELALFYGRLIETWFAASVEAAAGVSISASNDSNPDDCFASLPQEFPALVEPRRLRGSLIWVDDLPSFSNDVAEELWKGL